MNSKHIYTDLCCPIAAAPWPKAAAPAPQARGHFSDARQSARAIANHSVCADQEQQRHLKCEIVWQQPRSQLPMHPEHSCYSNAGGTGMHVQNVGGLPGQRC
jgi:hypothetical protein